MNGMTRARNTIRSIDTEVARDEYAFDAGLAQGRREREAAL